MIERQQVNLRLERELVESLDDLARTEHVDRTEVARRILVDGVQMARVDRAVREYAAGRVTAWKAARDAGVSLYEMLDRIHEAGIPYELDPEDISRIGSADDDSVRKGQRVAEAAGRYGPPPRTADADTGVTELRKRYRPATVRRLFVGESSPAQGTHFYRANSNLFRATRAAFAEALGDDVVPPGEAFLRFFQDQGCWLVDLAEQPVNLMSGADRRRVVDEGVELLAQTVRDTSPETIVAVKRNIEEPVRRAISQAGAEGIPLVVLPFPVRQWRSSYEKGLAAILRPPVHPRGISR